MDKLKEYIGQFNKVAVAFSAGVDSTFLLCVCATVLGKDNVIAVTVNSDMFPKTDCDLSISLAEKIGVKQIFLNADEYTVKEFTENSRERCYYCKKNIFKKIIACAKEHSISTVFDGSNVDDINDYRPGMRALKELGVISPLMETGMVKSVIRQKSAELGLETAYMPSKACLASRIQYGEQITHEKLKMVNMAEDFLKNKGFTQFRVRHHNCIARIEVMPSEMDKIIELKDEISLEFNKIGYIYTTLDLQGFRSGSMNEVIKRGKIK